MEHLGNDGVSSTGFRDVYMSDMISSQTLNFWMFFVSYPAGPTGKRDLLCLPSLKLSAKAPENLWLESMKFPFSDGPFSGFNGFMFAMFVSGYIFLLVKF